MDDKRGYTSAMAFDDLDGIPDDTELQRLVEYYPSYEKEHRKGIIKAVFDGTKHTELVLKKLDAKGIEYPISKQAKGGHVRWVVAKVKRTVIRLLYLRYRLDQNMTRRSANQKLLKQFKFSDDLDTAQSNIRKATRSPVLDK